jgi:hypothetical protein
MSVNYLSALMTNPDITTSDIEDSINHLEMDEKKFVVKREESGGGQYSVALKHLGDVLKEGVIESYLSERFKIVGLRVWKLLKHKGMLGEKEVCLLKTFVRACV